MVIDFVSISKGRFQISLISAQLLYLKTFVFLNSYKHNLKNPFTKTDLVHKKHFKKEHETASYQCPFSYCFQIPLSYALALTLSPSFLGYQKLSLRLGMLLKQSLDK